MVLSILMTVFKFLLLSSPEATPDYRRLSLSLLKHFYKTKPSGLAAILVFDNSC
jgi:hypothetical protein